MLDCAKQTFAQEGVRGLYRGAASPLIGACFHNASVFFWYGGAKRLIGADKRDASLKDIWLAGALAGVPVSFVESPVDLLKIKLQIQPAGEGEYTGVIDAARKILGQYGIKGLYQGLVSTIVRNVPCFGMFFWGSEMGYRLLNDPLNHEPVSMTRSFFGGLIGGMCAGFGFWGIFYPLETVKTRLQSDHLEESRRVYKSYLDCVHKTYAQGGMQAFYKGWLPANVRAVVVNGAIFCGVFAIRNKLDS